ncbi:MAG: hypothetical protein IBJ14_08400 [Hydrogenophaga sp.]|nr:hypothetical protein [Hydrogenophaga sp.]
MATSQTRPFTIFGYYIDRIDAPEGHSVADEIAGFLLNPANYSGDVSNVSCSNGNGHDFELRDVQIDPSFQFVRGTLARIREDRPPVRDANKAVHPLHLAPGSNLLENNYFHYRRRDRLLFWHFNLRANFPSNFAQMLTRMTGNQLTYAATQVVKHSVLDDVTAIDVVDFAVSAPRNRLARESLDQVDPSSWGWFNPFQTMTDTGASTMSARIATRRSAGLNQGAVRQLIQGLQATVNTKKLRVELTDVDEPIDLLADRFKHKTEVQLDLHRNPHTASIWRAIDEAIQLFDQSAQDA